MINIPDWHIDKKRPNEPLQSLPGHLSETLHNELWVEYITEISDAWPNYLVPSGLIYNEASWKLFDYLKSKWIKFYLDTKKKEEKWYSNKDWRFIFLWLKTPRSYTKNMWIANNVSEDTKTQLVFLHEMCHHLAWELYDNNESFNKLFRICGNLRKKRPQNWVSGLADMNFYQSRWINTQATDDCVELLRIYFMCRENESQCFEYIKNKLQLNDDTASKTIFNLLAQSVNILFPHTIIHPH